jgi:hypothetical protein
LLTRREVKINNLFRQIPRAPSRVMLLGIRRRAYHRAIFEHYLKASFCPFSTRGRDPRSNTTLIPRHQIVVLGHKHSIAAGERGERDSRELHLTQYLVVTASELHGNPTVSRALRDRCC